MKNVFFLDSAVCHVDFFRTSINYRFCSIYFNLFRVEKGTTSKGRKPKFSELKPKNVSKYQKYLFKIRVLRLYCKIRVLRFYCKIRVLRLYCKIGVLRLYCKIRVLRLYCKIRVLRLYCKMLTLFSREKTF